MNFFQTDTLLRRISRQYISKDIRTRLVAQIRKYNLKKDTKPAIPQETYEKLLSMYTPHIQELEEFMNRDLSIWKK